jgi:PAS domain S-box-containing protein
VVPPDSPDRRAQAFDASPLALLVLDQVDAIDVANLATGRFLGTTVGELAGRELRSLIHRDQQDEVNAMIAMARAGKRPDRREILFLRPDGTIRIGGFSVSKVDGSEDVVVVIRDITLERQLQDEASERARLRLDYEVAQRREAEGTAERAETGLRLLIDTIPDIAMVHERGRLVHVNHVAVSALGYDTASDLIGRLVLDLVHPDDWVATADRIRAVNEAGTITSPRIIHVQRKDGSYLDLEFVGVPIAFRGRPHALSLGRDLTERKKLEAKLALSERLVAMGRLVAGIGHEINNPLSYVMGNLELLQETLPPSPESDELIRDCLEGAERIRKIIAGLKSMSRGGEHRAPIDLRRVIELAIAMTHNEVRHRAQLAIDLRDTPAVMADENRLGQVFVNLLVNAAQSIAEGQAATNEIAVKTWTDAFGRACIEIRDSGCGVPAEDLGRIFDPFFTTKAVGVGTGLGLSISHNIVTEYGGMMTVSSELGHGTTFRVVLPPSPFPRKTATETIPPVRTDPAQRARVLVIDDEPAIGVLVRRTLSTAHDVIVTHSGPEAIERIAKGDAFDVILCDLMMPDMTGMDVFARLSELAPEQARRITFITGGAFTRATTEFIESTRHEVLEKPFTADGLRAAVRAMIDRSPRD